MTHPLYPSVKAKVEKWWEIACGIPHRNVSLLRERFPEIELSTRMTTRAGYAQGLHKPRIVLNANLLVQEGENFNATIGHEVAHIAVNILMGEQCGHDKRWGYMMTIFRLPVVRCHSYNVEKIRHQRFTHICKGCGVQMSLTQNRLTRMQNGQVYICVKCRTPIN